MRVIFEGPARTSSWYRGWTGNRPGRKAGGGDDLCDIWNSKDECLNDDTILRFKKISPVKYKLEPLYKSSTATFVGGHVAMVAFRRLNHYFSGSKI